jgi:hypothetical protein
MRTSLGYVKETFPQNADPHLGYTALQKHIRLQKQNIGANET